MSDELEWTCPSCGRRFAREGQGHECAPALSLDEYFSTGPPFERPIFDAVVAHLRSLDAGVWFEPVSVGIFFKRRTAFVQLRTMVRWVAVCFDLRRRVDSPRLARKVVAHGSRYYHVVNVRLAAEIDDELRAWLTEAWEADRL